MSFRKIPFVLELLKLSINIAVSTRPASDDGGIHHHVVTGDMVKDMVKDMAKDIRICSRIWSIRVQAIG